MVYRSLGQTDMKVSALGLGTSSLGGVYEQVEEKEGVEMVFSALENGINFIDTSPYYGVYKAEEVLGKALKAIPREKYYLSTKVGRYGINGKKEWNYTRERVIKSVEESLKRLYIDYIDLINVHDIEFADPYQVINETLPALDQLKEQGKVRYVGISGLPLKNLKNIVQNTQKGLVDTVLSFCHYTLHDDSLIDYIDYFKRNGVGVINASPLAMGLFTYQGPPNWHPGSERLKKVCREAVEYCTQFNFEIEKLAIKYPVKNELIPTTLVSTPRKDTIKKNIKWAEEPLEELFLNEVKNILKPVYRETWLNT